MHHQVSNYGFKEKFISVRTFLFQDKQPQPSDSGVVWGFSSIFSCDHEFIPEAVWLCNQPNLNATFPDVCGMSAAPSWFFLPVLEYLPATDSEHRSVWRLDNGIGRFACGTHARRVCARDTSITWQEPTRRAWLWAPWRHHTQSDSADKIMMSDNVTAACALHVENTALKNSILS